MGKRLKSSTTTRVRYAETDQAGVVYHSNYLIYFEIGRTGLMRDLGMPYSEVEKNLGVVLAVVDCSLRFRYPAKYDDLLCIETEITKVRGTRITFEYRVLRDADEKLLCDGSTVLAAVRDGKAVRMPGEIVARCGLAES